MPSTSTIASLAPDVQNRLQDPSGIFWNQQYETFAGLAEAMTELLLIVGRPTATFNSPVTLAANTVWQPMPSGLLCLTDIFLAGSRLKKTTLRSLDYLCASWSSSWESDRAAQPARWASLGLNYFVVHPAPLQPISVNVTGIAYPLTDAWPPVGTETSPFHVECDQALQLYATAYCRLKEIGDDAEVGMQLYQQFLEIGQRLSTIESRRDDLVWTRSIGAPTAPSQVAHR
jgi:hypothetical protein